LCAYKRVTSISIDKENKIYTFKLAEKYPQNEDVANIEKKFEYFCSYLDSQNNELAHNVAEIIRKSYKKDNIIKLLVNQDTFNSSKEKFYIFKICDSKHDSLLQMPYFKRLTKYHKNMNAPELIEITVNQKFLDLIK